MIERSVVKIATLSIPYRFLLVGDLLLCFSPSVGVPVAAHHQRLTIIHDVQATRMCSTSSDSVRIVREEVSGIQNLGTLSVHSSANRSAKHIVESSAAMLEMWNLRRTAKSDQALWKPVGSLNFCIGTPNTEPVMPGTQTCVILRSFLCVPLITLIAVWVWKKEFCWSTLVNFRFFLSHKSLISNQPGWPVLSFTGNKAISAERKNQKEDRKIVRSAEQ